MRTLFHTLVLALMLSFTSAGSGLVPDPAQAQDNRTGNVTFTVENMTCALCPVTVKKAMQSVPGVIEVRVNMENGTATARFDPAVTDPETISAASTRAGYPATPADAEG